MKNYDHCNSWKCAHHIGLFLVALLVLCFVWRYIHPVEIEFHLSSLRLMFFGFSGFNFWSFVLGAIQAYIAAYIGVGVWFLVGCCLKGSDSCEKGESCCQNKKD